MTLASGVTLAGFDLSTGAAAGLSGAGVAGVTVAMRDLTTTTGTAVSISGQRQQRDAIVPQDLRQRRRNGIVVQNLAGSFTVNGDGANTSVGGNGSGGTISNMIGADSTAQTAPFAGVGVYLNNVQNITLRRMTINGANQNYGIRGFAVNGFTLEYCTVSGTNGTAAILDAPEEAGEGSIYFGNSTTNGLSTSAVFTGNVIQGGRARNLSITNTTAGLTTLMFKGNTFGLNQNFIDADQSLAVEAIGSGTRISAIVGGAGGNDANIFIGAPGDLVSFTGQADTAMDVVFQQQRAVEHPRPEHRGRGRDDARHPGRDDVRRGEQRLQRRRRRRAHPVQGQRRRAPERRRQEQPDRRQRGGGLRIEGRQRHPRFRRGRRPAGPDDRRQHDRAVQRGRHLRGQHRRQLRRQLHHHRQHHIAAGPRGLRGAGAHQRLGRLDDTINVCAKITGNSFGAGDPTNTSDALIVASGAGGGPGHTFNLPGYAGSTIADVAGFLAANNPPPAATVFAVRTDAPVTAAAFTGTGTSCPTPP